MIVFVSGIRTQSAQFDAKLGKGNLNTYSGILSVEIYSEAVIEIIQISYIIYDRYTPLQI